MSHPLTRTTTVAAVLAAALLLPTGGTAAADRGERSPLDRVLAAHGGIDTWRSFGRMDYGVRDFPLGAQAPLDYTETVALGPRHYRVDAEAYTAAFDGEHAWITPDAEALGLPPRFFLAGNFYFVGMPFVFGDPGIQARDLEPETLDGRLYDRIAVRFDAKTGDSAEDDYILYVDPESDRLHMINFAVTYGAVRGDTPVDQVPRKVLVFDEWQTVQGLVVPAKATFYAFGERGITGDGASFTIPDVRFAREAPSSDLFTASPDAAIDDSHLAD